MTKTSDAAQTDRRSFLKLATTALPAAVAVAATSGQTAEAATTTTVQGLQDTAHSRAYYENARF